MQRLAATLRSSLPWIAAPGPTAVVGLAKQAGPDRLSPSASARPVVCNQGRPIILVHGFAATSAMMIPLERYLRCTLRRPVVRVSLGRGLPLHLQSIRASARVVYETVERLARQPGFEHADIVGHSLGGLVAVYVLKLLDRGRYVRRVVTLGAPHRGTPIAALGTVVFGIASRAIWQMLPGSSLLRELAERPVPRGAELVAVASRADAVVPYEFATVDAMPRQLTAVVSRVGHLQMPVSTEVLVLVETLLARERVADTDVDEPCDAWIDAIDARVEAAVA